MDTRTDDSLPVINWTARVDVGGHTDGTVIIWTARVDVGVHTDR